MRFHRSRRSQHVPRYQMIGNLGSVAPNKCAAKVASAICCTHATFFSQGPEQFLSLACPTPHDFSESFSRPAAISTSLLTSHLSHPSYLLYNKLNTSPLLTHLSTPHNVSSSQRKPEGVHDRSCTWFRYVFVLTRGFVR